MKKVMACLLIAALALFAFAGCSGDGDTSGTSSTPNSNTGSTTGGGSDETFDASHEISVITREDGSGTRSAFTELFEIEEITLDAVTNNNTSVVMTTVAGNPYAIGYISLGSLNETVKALQIDGVDASVANIENGTYKISRPFNIAYKEGLSEVAQDFVNFIMSTEGQAVVEEEGYIPLKDVSAYAGSKPAGTVTVSGSSSVTPLMEKLKEAYEALNTGAEIQLQQSDSTTGMNDAIAGTSDIGMASRAVKDSELEQGLTAVTIATDGIAVIVNNDCPVDGMTSEQIREIYTGAVTTWSGVAG